MRSSSTPPLVGSSRSRLRLCRPARWEWITSKSSGPLAGRRLTPSRWPRGACLPALCFLLTDSSPGYLPWQGPTSSRSSPPATTLARGANCMHWSSTPPPVRRFCSRLRSAERHGGRPQPGHFGHGRHGALFLRVGLEACPWALRSLRRTLSPEPRRSREPPAAP